MELTFEDIKEKLLKCKKSGLVETIQYMVEDFTELPTWNEEDKEAFLNLLVRKASGENVR